MSGVRVERRWPIVRVSCEHCTYWQGVYAPGLVPDWALPHYCRDGDGPIGWRVAGVLHSIPNPLLPIIGPS